MRRASAASVDSQFPVDPHASRGATGDAGRLAALLRPYAVDVIAKLAGVAGLDQAVNVGIESRKLLVEVARELQELDDGAVKALARNQQWNARRIRRQQNAGHAAFELVDLDAVDLPMRHAGERVGGLHRRL